MLHLILAFGNGVRCLYNLDGWADVRVDVAPQHGLLDLQDLPLDDNVLDATHEWDSVGVESFKPKMEGMN